MSWSGRALALLAVLASIFFLKQTAVVTLPIAFAIFIIALLWPLYARLAKPLPRAIAAVVCSIVFLVTIGLVGLGLFHAADVVSEKAPRYQAQWTKLSSRVESWERKYEIALPLPGDEASQDGAETSNSGIAKRIAKKTSSALSGLVLVIALLVLGLLEVLDFRRALLYRLPDDKRKKVAETTSRMAHDFRMYIVVRTGVGLVTGVAVGLGAWAIGLDFPFIWGLANFLLNYIPTLGSIIGVFPPVVFAALQSLDVGFTLLALAVVGGVQLLMGNFIDPLVQGKYLKLSPVVVLLSVVFWGWVWGIPGAFIGTPMTIAVVLVTRELERTRWIARLLAPRELA